MDASNIERIESGPAHLDKTAGDTSIEDTSAADAAILAIKAIPQSLFSERVCAAIVCALANRVSDSNWAHTAQAIDAMGALDDLHDELVYLS
jgi:hypothetical protein